MSPTGESGTFASKRKFVALARVIVFDSRGVEFSGCFNVSTRGVGSAWVPSDASNVRSPGWSANDGARFIREIGAGRALDDSGDAANAASGAITNAPATTNFKAKKFMAPAM